MNTDTHGLSGPGTTRKQPCPLAAKNAWRRVSMPFMFSVRLRGRIFLPKPPFYSADHRVACQTWAALHDQLTDLMACKRIPRGSGAAVGWMRCGPSAAMDGRRRAPRDGLSVPALHPPRSSASPGTAHPQSSASPGTAPPRSQPERKKAGAFGARNHRFQAWETV